MSLSWKALLAVCSPPIASSAQVHKLFVLVFSNEPGSGAMPQKPLDASAHLQQTAEENLMSYIIFKVRFCMVLVPRIRSSLCIDHTIKCV